MKWQNWPIALSVGGLKYALEPDKIISYGVMQQMIVRVATALCIFVCCIVCTIGQVPRTSGASGRVVEVKVPAPSLRLADGKLLTNESALEKWKTRLPINMVDSHKQNLLSLRGIFVDVGQNEEFVSILRSTPRLSKALADQRVSHSFEMYEGGTHGNKLRDRFRDRLFPFLSEKLDFSSP